MSRSCGLSLGRLPLISFDIVSPVRSGVAEAELLDVVDKVISEFRGIRASSLMDYEFHVSHENGELSLTGTESTLTASPVLSVLVASAPDRLRSQVLKAFKSIGSGVTFAQSRTQLSGVAGLPKPILDDLEQCCITGES